VRALRASRSSETPAREVLDQTKERRRKPPCVSQIEEELLAGDEGGRQ
jgi:hypothetical protein